MMTFEEGRARTRAWLAVVVVLAGCDNEVVWTLTGDCRAERDEVPVPAATQTVMNTDEEHAFYAAHVPGGFGGLFRGPSTDGSGWLHVYLTSPEDSTEAIAALLPLLKARGGVRRRGLSAADVTIRKGRYDWLELMGCKQRVYEGGWIEGMVMFGIDESTNRLHIGIEGEHVRARLMRRLYELGVPREMVRVGLASRPVPLGTSETETRTTRDRRRALGQLRARAREHLAIRPRLSG